MKRFFTIIIALAIGFSTSAQQLTPSVIANGGGQMNNLNVQLSFTVGEPVTGRLSNNDVIFSEGFQQCSAGITVSVTEITDASPKIQVFPNPAKDLINISFENMKPERVLFQLFDINGVMISETNSDGQLIKNQISLTGLANQTYLLKIVTVSGELKGTYKIQKLN